MTARERRPIDGLSAEQVVLRRRERRSGQDAPWRRTPQRQTRPAGRMGADPEPAGSALAVRSSRARPLWRVFLSHTGELRDHPVERSFVAAAEAAVVRTTHAVINMAYFGARDAWPADTCVSMIAAADIYVGIIGMRYGSIVPARPELSYTELEFETATRLGLTRLMFLIREDSPSLPPVVQPAEHGARLLAFRKRLSHQAGLTIAWISSPADLELELLHALTAMEADHDRAGWA